jgi:hypothetical protein
LEFETAGIVVASGGDSGMVAGAGEEFWVGVAGFDCA